MTDSELIPGSHSYPIAPSGQFAGEWYRFFRELIRYVQETEGNTAELAALEARVAALEAAGQNPLTLLGPFSVQVLGSLLDGSATVQLVNDESNPGAWRFYATDESGGKAWLPLYPNVVPNPYADYPTDPDGNYLTDPDGNFLMSQDGFPIPLEYGGTGADNSTVAANLVWASPDGMAGAPVFRALVGDDLPDHNDLNGLQGGNATERYHFTAAEHTELQTLTAGGTTGQFWRGDGAWSNELRGDMTFRNTSVNNEYRKLVTTATMANENLMGLNAYGANGSADALGGTLNFRASELWTSTANGCQFEVRLVAPGTTTLAVKLRVLGDGTVQPFVDNAQKLGDTSLRWVSTYTKDLILGLQTASLGGGVGVAFISNATTVPTSNPANGGILYVSGGALFYRGSSGTVTPLAPA